MDTVTGNESFSVPCPGCKKEIVKPLSWFNKDIVLCPFCKAMIHTRDFRPALQAAERNAARHHH